MTRFKDATIVISFHVLHVSTINLLWQLPWYDGAEAAHHCTKLGTVVSKSIQENREKMHSVLNIVISYGHQNAALKGHHDDSTITDNSNPGIVWELPDFCVKRVAILSWNLTSKMY